MFFAIEVVTIPILFNINSTITLYLILPLPIIGFVATKLIRHLASTSREVQDHNAVMSSQVQELYSGARVIKAFNREETAISNFFKTSDENVNVNMRFAFARSYFLALIMSSAVIMQLLFIVIGGGELLDGTLTIADFVKFNLYLIWIVMPMAYLGWGINLYHRGKASMQRLQEVFDVEPDIRDEDCVDTSITSVKGDIEFKDLSFSYGNLKVLSNVSVKIKSGETVAIVEEQAVENLHLFICFQGYTIHQRARF